MKTQGPFLVDSFTAAAKAGVENEPTTAALKRCATQIQARDRVLQQAEPSELRQAFLRWLKFNLVGGIGIGVQLVALAFLRSVLHLDYLVATGLAVETAVIHNFLWHERFTWVDRRALRFSHSFTRLVKFNTSNGLVSLAGNLLIMRLLVGQLHVNYVIANLIAVTTCSVVNFLLSDRFVFER